MRFSFLGVAVVAALGVVAVGQQPGPAQTTAPTQPVGKIGALPATPRQIPSGPVPAHLQPGQGGPGLYLQTQLGSFKIKRGSEQQDVGILDIDFKGTVLISGLSPTGVATPSAGVKLEYYRADHNKRVFYGKGHLHIDGDFDGILWFGENMKALYHGTGVIQLFGEFDKQLNTGTYWYASNPSTKMYWGTGGATITPAPFKMQGQNVEVKVTKDQPSGTSKPSGSNKPAGKG